MTKFVERKGELYPESYACSSSTSPSSVFIYLCAPSPAPLERTLETSTKHLLPKLFQTYIEPWLIV